MFSAAKKKKKSVNYEKRDLKFRKRRKSNSASPDESHNISVNHKLHHLQHSVYLTSSRDVAGVSKRYIHPLMYFNFQVNFACVWFHTPRLPLIQRTPYWTKTFEMRLLIFVCFSVYSFSWFQRNSIHRIYFIPSVLALSLFSPVENILKGYMNLFYCYRNNENQFRLRMGGNSVSGEIHLTACG